MIQKLTREELYDMNTTQLYRIDEELSKLQQKIKAELICRGDY
jgi:hypothetical protein